MESQELLSFMLPDGILDYFEINDASKTTTSFTIELTEKNIKPENYKNNRLESKGFYEPSTIQDFPLRGKACYLRVKRRRWLNKDTGIIVTRDWNIIAKGTRITSDFATFLKEFN